MEEDGYRWESGYEKTWEVLQEDAGGSIQDSVLSFVHQAKRRRLAERKANVRLGIMRYVYIILDFSDRMSQTDYRPSRQDCIISQLINFIDEFFEQNPMSQLGFIVTRDRRAEKLCELSANSRKLKDSLKKASDFTCGGEPSLQNSLDLGLQGLKRLPAYCSKEILLIWGNITSIDPGNINQTKKLLRDHQIRVSAINLSAEITFLRVLCAETNGIQRVPLDVVHLQELLAEQTLPLPVPDSAQTNLIKMGFPSHKVATGMLSLCQCHADSETPSERQFSTDGFFCPQCQAKYCDLPVECKICGLVLVSAPHLARSYHHLFPLPQFSEDKVDEGAVCTGCMQPLQHKCYLCSDCKKPFCVECDLFLHETLHTCPGCDI